jgi:hypothetical protein
MASWLVPPIAISIAIVAVVAAVALIRLLA